MQGNLRRAAAASASLSPLPVNANVCKKCVSVCGTHHLTINNQQQQIDAVTSDRWPPLGKFCHLFELEGDIKKLNDISMFFFFALSEAKP